MSAMGHKRTYAAQKGMSALPPKAGMCSAPAHVCYVPKADIHESWMGAADEGGAHLSDLLI